MEDRYLFKGKEKDSGKWLEWNAIAGIPHNVTILTNTICQCTGLRDKNGKLIWENDVVGLYNENKAKRYAVGSVEYGTCNCSCCDGVYGWYFTDNADIRESGRYEVIGNVFDNKDLLESEE